MAVDFFAQALGVTGFVMGLWAFAQADDQRMKQILTVATWVFVAHFMLLDAQVAAAVSALTALRVWISTYSRSYNWMLVFIAAQIGLSTWLMSDWLEVLPLLNGLLGIFAMFRLAGAPLRLVMVACGLLGVAYNLAIGSVGGSLMDTTVIIMNLATIARLRRSERAAEQELGS